VTTVPPWIRRSCAVALDRPTVKKTAATKANVTVERMGDVISASSSIR
jgi:hypothetical protein